jgi:hypothetical protein
MDRLNFKIPEFVRIAWATAKAQEVWEPRIQKCSNFFTYLERLDRTAIISLKPDELIHHPYRPIPLAQVNTSQTYQAGSPEFRANQPWEYRCAIGPRAESLAISYIKQDWIDVGRILGYPECCIQFFQQYWVDEQWFDTTYPMGKNNVLSSANNILLRWVGIRLVSHLPCSFNCFGTMQIGERNIQLARELGYNEEIDHIIEMLSWPIEWSSLHGIAIITTPVFKIITASDALPFRSTFKLEGIKYPEEAGSGLIFPFRRGQEHLVNGFTDQRAMDEAHGRIIKSVKHLQPKSILDLGCGSGLLLRKMSREFDAFTFGVDQDDLKRPDLCANIYDFEFQRDFDLVLIAEQRIREDHAAYATLLARIYKHVRYLCIYNYNTGLIRIETFHGQTSIAN